MTNLLGWGFEAYARLLHPCEDHPGPLTWASVARANGRIMHASVQWEKIRAATPLIDGKYLSLRGRGYPGEPKWGELQTWALEALCAILARHTATPQLCYFAVWPGVLRDGGMMIAAPQGVRPQPPPAPAPAEWQLDLSGPTFSFPDSGDSSYYHLFEGQLSEAVRIGRWKNQSWFRPQSPHFFWPADQSWCAADERYADSTLIGGSLELINELCASEVLEVLRIAPDAPYEDHLNV